MELKDIHINDLPSYYRNGLGKEYIEGVITGIDKYTFYASNYIDREDKAIIQGEEGEKRTEEWLKERGYIVIRNIYLPYKEGFTQIDMVALNENTQEILIIEVKNWNNATRYTVNYDADEWEVSYNSTVQAYYNPIKQHRAHMSALELVPELETYLSSFQYEVFIWQNDNLARYTITNSDNTTEGVKENHISNSTFADIEQIFMGYATNSFTMRTIHAITLDRRLTKVQVNREESERVESKHIEKEQVNTTHESTEVQENKGSEIPQELRKKKKTIVLVEDNETKSSK